MSNNISSFKNIEEALENPGAYIFQLNDNQINFSKNKSIYNTQTINTIKNNIIKCFRTLHETLPNNSEYLNHIKNILFSYTQNQNFKFPGLQVINFNREQLEFFSHFPKHFLICEKSDGVRYLLIQFANGISIMIGRNLKFYQIKLNINFDYKVNENDRSSYAWEIINFFDGELILDDIVYKENNNNIKEINTNMVYINNTIKQVKFLIFDAIMLRGELIGFLPFYMRLNELNYMFNDIRYKLLVNKSKNNFLSHFHKSLNLSNFIKIPEINKEINKYLSPNYSTYIQQNFKYSISLYMKDYFYLNQLDILQNYINKLKHHNDGVIINTNDYPYYSGQSCEIYKWKPSEMNTIDFEVEFNDNLKLYILKIGVKDGNIPVSILNFKDDDENNFKEGFKENKINVIECYFDKKLDYEYLIKFNYIYNQSKINNINNDNRYNIDNVIKELQNKKNNEFDTISNELKEKFKGGWRFSRFRNDKGTPNFINTYENILQVLEEDILLKDIINKVKENENNILPDLKNEGGSISAAVWKKYFKKKNNNNESEDDEFDDLMNSEDENIININNKNINNNNDIKNDINNKNNNDFSYIGKKKERENENNNLNNSNIDNNIFEDDLDDEEDLD